MNSFLFSPGSLGSSTKDYPYQIGVAALYTSLNVKVVPVALNSGKFWGKGCFIKNKGKIKMKFLDPIEPGLNKKEFMKVLEEKIENESKELLN
jgi:1-acyl-sn-glycerol-3-phosphate acyltransferase